MLLASPADRKVDKKDDELNGKRYELSGKRSKQANLRARKPMPGPSMVQQSGTISMA